MSQDRFTHVTRQSWGGRIGNSIKGVIVGVIFIAGSIFLLSWNEGRSVKTARSLDEGAKAVISIDSTHVDPAKEGNLVHLTGIANTDETLTDPEFGVSVNAIKLVRHVAMYQWQESTSSKTDKELGGGTKTTKTYTYKKTWSDRLIDSSDFEHPEDHQNPGAMAYQSRDFLAEEVLVDGTFALTDSLKRKINNYEPYLVDSSSTAGILSDRFQTYDGGYYSGTPESPNVGDLKVSFKIIKPPLLVSIVARQTGNSFSAYPTRSGDSLEFLRVGALSAAEMFKKAQEENALLTWVLRGAGCLFMFIGFALVFAPLSVLADVIPFLGNLMELGTGLAALLLAFLVSLVTIAVAWFAYRPVLSIVLILVAVIIFVVIPNTGGRKNQKVI